MARYLIDTDVMIDVPRRNASAASFVDSLADITISIVTAHELLKRYAKSSGLRTFDALIAATAIEEGFVLVSRNRKHFQMISELNVETPGY